MIEREKMIEVKGSKLRVKFPNVGQLIDMESLKVAISSGRYGQMALAGIKSMTVALDFIDAMVFFSILCPQVKNLYGVKELTSLDPSEGKELVEIYLRDIRPWYSKIESELYASGSTESKNAEQAD